MDYYDGGERMDKIEPVRPTPSDFAQFVFCGLQWGFDKENKFGNVVKARRASYDRSETEEYRKIGQGNEHLCVDWVLKHHRISNNEILYNGTGSLNLEPLSFEFMGENYTCKPDLIIHIFGKKVLYEFKAVGNPKHLGSQYESNKAQLWCYSRINEILIDKYFLLQYFVNPFYSGLPNRKNSYSKTEYIPNGESEINSWMNEILQLEKVKPIKFTDIFKSYLDAINYRKIKDTRLIGILKTTAPDSETEKRKKCSGCIYGTTKLCPVGSEVN